LSWESSANATVPGLGSAIAAGAARANAKAWNCKRGTRNLSPGRKTLDRALQETGLSPLDGRTPLGRGRRPRNKADVETRDLTFDPEDPAVAHAVFFRRVVRSSNGGFRWRVSLPGAVALERDPRYPRVLWAAGQSSFFKTTDDGATWVEIDPGFPPDILRGDPLFTDLAFDPRGGGILYAATQSRGIFRSRNGGETWEPINAGLPLLDVRVLAIDPSAPGGLFAGAEGAGIWEGRF
jgi:hypothetical protein